MLNLGGCAAEGGPPQILNEMKKAFLPEKRNIIRPSLIVGVVTRLGVKFEILRAAALLMTIMI